jgi:hypothetical protein
MAEDKTVVAYSGDVFQVDTSDEVCGKFGFKHGDAFIHNVIKEEGIIMGVARSLEWQNEGKPVLWYAMKGYDDIVFWVDSGKWLTLKN